MTLIALGVLAFGMVDALAMIPGPQRMLAQHFFGFEAITYNISTPALMDPVRRQSAIADIGPAECSPRAFYGPFSPRPIIILCPAVAVKAR